jgi:hypothetical protein
LKEKYEKRNMKKGKECVRKERMMSNEVKIGVRRIPGFSKKKYTKGTKDKKDSIREELLLAYYWAMGNIIFGGGGKGNMVPSIYCTCSCLRETVAICY